jgi:hypothetical protein
MVDQAAYLMATRKEKKEEEEKRLLYSSLRTFPQKSNFLLLALPLMFLLPCFDSTTS